MASNIVDKCAAIVLDVAGTTTSISFVKETLIPFASKNVEEYLKTNWEDEKVAAVIKNLKPADEEQEGDAAAEEVSLEKVVEAFNKAQENAETDAAEPVKQLEGLVYAKGYSEGTLKGHVFDDVPAALESWSSGEKKVAIYSSGSVDSQKLLFEHSSAGDLTKHIAQYFDQSVGSKVEAGSYAKVAEQMGCEVADVVFVTDNVAEAKAAKEAGCQVILVEREGNAELAEDDRKEFTVVRSFEEIAAGAAKPAAVKRKPEDGDQADEEVKAKAPKRR